jgi:hypothetical protein
MIHLVADCVEASFYDASSCRHRRELLFGLHELRVQIREPSLLLSDLLIAIRQEFPEFEDLD